MNVELSAERRLPRLNAALATLALCFAAAIADGYDVVSMGLAAPRMAPAIGLTRDQLGPVFSAAVLGLFIGAVGVGRLADRIGRKPCLAGALCLVAGFSLATPPCRSFESLLVVRLLAGVGFGGAMPNIIALASEQASERARARTVTIIAAGFPLGSAAASAVAAIADWRAIFWVGGLYPLLLAAAVAIALPESARFLARAPPHRSATAPGLPRALFGDGRWLTTLILWLASFAVLLVLYLLLNWLPLLLTAKGLGKGEASLVTMGFHLASATGALPLGLLMGRRRRAWSLCLWFAGLGAGLIALALAPSFAWVVPAALAVGFFVSPPALALNGLAAEAYPVVMRGSGVGASIAVGRIGAVIGPLLAGAILAAGGGAGGVLIGLTPIVAAAAIAVLLLLTRPASVD
ncbi:MAG TPA: MFS transporter [Caulobacteraceae bacterium]|nr:MFS transporter [Caulobacteraceae bacterium]